MPRVINTEFDGTIDESVQLEQIGGKPPAVEETLANAENIYKSFLYLRKMYSYFPNKSTILKADTINSGTFSRVDMPVGTNRVTVKNIGTGNAKLKINGGEYVILPGEKDEIDVVFDDDPNVQNTVLEMVGNISYLAKNVQEF